MTTEPWPRARVRQGQTAPLPGSENGPAFNRWCAARPSLYVGIATVPDDALGCGYFLLTTK